MSDLSEKKPGPAFWAARGFGLLWIILALACVYAVLIYLPTHPPDADNPEGALTHLQLHSALYLPWGDHTAACRYLQAHGKAMDVQPLINVILHMEATEPDDTGARQVCLNALTSITGQDFGSSGDEWLKWWKREHGNDLND